MTHDSIKIFAHFHFSGLDDLSCSQCVSLLRRIAHGGRTVICSVHTPSAKIFEMFDHVYILANGQCVYQGQGANLIPYTQAMGLNCPVTYNPADFSEQMIESIFQVQQKLTVFFVVVCFCCSD